ncbi:hypothetical protein [Bradyrhizobium sp. S3.9.1]|uniref:hypothetical protein n=1 Tax=Bradyrhizobium sp. S3.9.1 TaxID=3156431 RepID=UPI0033919FDA
MGWRAETMFGEIIKGTELSVFLEPWERGAQPDLFAVGDVLGGTHPNNDPFQLNVITVDQGVAVVENESARWKMNRVSRDQLKYPADTGDAPATHWVIVDKA